MVNKLEAREWDLKIIEHGERIRVLKDGISCIKYGYENGNKSMRRILWQILTVKISIQDFKARLTY